MPPAARLEPLTLRVATAPFPDATRFAEPRDLPPVAKLTVPVGTLAPAACFTVAVRTNDAAAGIDAGVEVTAVDVRTRVAAAGAPTDTVAVAVELPKPAEPK